MSLFFWLVVLIALIAGHCRFWSSYYRIHRLAKQVHFAVTDDGWQLACHRYCNNPSYREPVVLFAGMGANRYNFDLLPDRSLAEFLSQAGFDVWLVELRGAGWSTRPGWFSPLSWTFSFDDHLYKDVPAVLDLIQST